eukprot:TRINITY_DN24618_c0_g1_i1.p1 TRINITY_DN24618_c0_g1~~TRINITY_DN24618_c0_g1_i1.p1  ORF type:complete len:305 (-),score=42.30 TRINITY_DN24618_c0_g1_i1:99-1013(-)
MTSASTSGPAGSRPGGQDNVNALERAVSALAGYTLGSIVVIPFDRLKTLMQVSAQRGEYSSAMVLARRLYATQGVGGLYQGAKPHMLIAPYAILYYSLYSELLELGTGRLGQFAPLGAAIVARTVETTVRMPLELLRTQMQADDGRKTLNACLRAQLSQPAASWLRGYVPTLLRDVPFSAVYWFSYEWFKNQVVIPEQVVSNPGCRTFAHSFSCGAAAGIIAALVTTPTDVIKTVRQQHVEAGRTPGYADILQVLQESPRRAFAGLGPRLIRIPLGLSTMMAGIEVSKWFFKTRKMNGHRGDER